MTDSARPEPDPALRATEQRNPRSANMDLMSPAELVALFVAEDRSVPEAVGAAADVIAAAVSRVEAAFRSGGRLIYVGAGTSGRLGVLDASECPPTFGTPPGMVQGVIAGGYDALVRSVEGAEDDPSAGAAALGMLAITPSDVVAGIAASGRTPFVHGALAQARACGSGTILFTCAAPPEDLRAMADILIHVAVGPELVTGSTRLKAGTATKLVLNMLTTGALVRLGKTYGNLMVDLQVTNAKLRERGERIIMEVLHVSREVARQGLEAAHGKVRTAIVMLHDGVDAPTAEATLASVDRRLRAIVGSPPEAA